jgi:hypothetical protein
MTVTLVHSTLSSLEGFRASLLCCAVGQSRTSCTDLVAMLKRVALGESSSTDASTSARVALASLGVDKEENLAAIQRTLSTSTNRGSVVLAMLLTRLGDWPAETIFPNLEVLIRKQNDESVAAAVLVGSWERNGQTALASIKEAAERSKTNSNQGAALLAYEFSKARLEKEGKHWITAELLRLLASDRVGFDHTVMSSCLLISCFLLNDGDISDVVQFLGDSDANVVLGASRLCWVIGIPARSAEKRMLELVESRKEERIRLSAALALGTLGSAQSLSRIRALEAKETSETVKTSLAAAERLISLQPISADR